MNRYVTPTMLLLRPHAAFIVHVAKAWRQQGRPEDRRGPRAFDARSDSKVSVAGLGGVGVCGPAAADAAPGELRSPATPNQMTAAVQQRQRPRYSSACACLSSETTRSARGDSKGGERESTQYTSSRQSNDHRRSRAARKLPVPRPPVALSSSACGRRFKAAFACGRAAMTWFSRPRKVPSAPVRSAAGLALAGLAGVADGVPCARNSSATAFLTASTRASNCA